MKIFGLTKLYFPVFLFLAFIVIFFIFTKDKETLYIISFEKIGLMIHVPVDSYIFKKILLLVSAFLSLCSYIFYDFSDFFPKRLKMEVYFDDEGINQLISLFTNEELSQLHIKTKDITQYQSDYYELLNSEALKLLKSEFFKLNRKDIHSEGETSFIVKKIAGVQNYHIRESKGEVKHLLEKPKSPSKEYYTFFEKIHSPADKLTPTFYDIFVKNKIILRPRFKQIIARTLKSKGKMFDHVLGGYTIINIFPYPRFSNTIYLLELDKVGLIPVGYAVYR